MSLPVRLDEPSWWYGDSPSAGIAGGGLAPVAALYGWGVRTRFARTRPYRSRLPVVCVGNLTAGGTGKTSAVLLAAEALVAEKRRPAVLSRGYKQIGRAHV